MRPLLVLRPEPQASQTAERARRLGLDPVVAPLFRLRPMAWDPPEAAAFDAVLLTSANAVRCAGFGLETFIGLPCYAVGPASARAAQAFGFGEVVAGGTDGAEIVAIMARDGRQRAFHPCGRDRIPLADPGVEIVDMPVYASETIDGEWAEKAAAALGRAAVALIHSPRAARAFSERMKEGRSLVTIVAISEAAARASGDGWAGIHVASEPADAAVLEVAVSLCNKDAE